MQAFWEDENKEKQLFLKIITNIFLQDFITARILESLGGLDLPFLITDIHSLQRLLEGFPWKQMYI